MIAIGCDHGGYDLKLKILEYLKNENLEFKDFGCGAGEKADYPDIAKAVCESIVSGECEKGVLICGTGIGISIAANKVHGIRAAVCGDIYSAEMAKRHNNANVITMGGRVIGDVVAVEIVKAWLGAEYEGGRHGARLDKIAEMERNS